MPENKFYRILHLEDNPIDAELIARSLKKVSMRFEIKLVQNRKEFEEGLENYNPDVILCDHSLPGFDSTQALEIYHQKKLDIAIILVTGSVSEEYAVEMMRKGIDDYLLKDNLHRLPQAIKGAWSKREKEKQRRLAEVKLAQSETLLRKAQQMARIGSLEVDLQTNQEIWSDELYILLGLLPGAEQPSLDLLLSFVHPEDMAFVQNNVRYATSEASDMSFYNRIIRKDGEVRHIHFECKYELNEKREKLKVHGIIHDITEKVLADQEKEFDRKNLSALINNTNDLIWSVDNEMKLITSNQAFDVMVKRYTGHIIEKGSPALRVNVEDAQLEMYKRFYERALAGETFAQVVNYSNSWFELSFYPIRKDRKVIGTACYARDISDYKHNEQEILEKNKKLKELTSHLQVVREEERKTIAREIHDELGQQLTALKMDVDWVLHKTEGARPGVFSRLQDMLKMCDGIINTVRRISSDLRPAIIDDLGLVAALEWKCHDFEKRTGIQCRFSSAVPERKFDNHFCINAFRILQETLTNVSRHAEAGSVRVELKEAEGQFVMDITDDGKGIPEERIHNGQTLGLLGMRERATLLGGHLIIERNKDKGTHTRLTLPIHEHEYINS